MALSTELFAPGLAYAYVRTTGMNPVMLLMFRLGKVKTVFCFRSLSIRFLTVLVAIPNSPATTEAGFRASLARDLIRVTSVSLNRSVWLAGRAILEAIRSWALVIRETSSTDRERDSSLL